MFQLKLPIEISTIIEITFEKITLLLQEINESIACMGVKIGIRTEYAIEYMEQITKQYASLFNLCPEVFVRGRGHHKSAEQRIYDKLVEYTEKLKKYAHHIRICGLEKLKKLSTKLTDKNGRLGFYTLKTGFLANFSLF